MCQIQLVKRFDNKLLSKKDIRGFSELLYYGSVHNDDAYGFFSEEGIIYKNNKRLEYKDVEEKLKGIKCNMLVGHNRFKTQGSADKMENNHPFETENFIVVHNGVLRNDDELKQTYNLNYDVETDSYIIIALMEYFFSNNYTDEDAIKLTAELIQGSYSVLVYCKTTKRLFYFKEKNTDFYFGLIENANWDLLVGSTDKDNIPSSFSTRIRGEFDVPIPYTVFEPEAHIIYEITETEVKMLTKFVESSWVWADYSGYSKKEEKKEVPATRTIFKELASEIIQNFAEHDIKVVNRKYDFRNNEIVLTTDKRLDDKQKTWVQESYVHIGDIDCRDEKNKTHVTIALDSDLINSYAVTCYMDAATKQGIKDLFPE